MKDDSNTGTLHKNPHFSVLLVEDDAHTIDQLTKYLREYTEDLYELEIIHAREVDTGLNLLTEASQGRPYDAVLLDFHLPLKQGGSEAGTSLALVKYCLLNQAKPARWVGQLTAFGEDSAIKNIWPERDSAIDFRGGLFVKDEDDFSQIARDMFFPEIKEPLWSDWLLAELGAVEIPFGRDQEKAPEGFNIYSYINRLGRVWPRLDEETQTRARELFLIVPGEEPWDLPKQIGFKSFRCWDE